MFLGSLSKEFSLALGSVFLCFLAGTYLPTLGTPLFFLTPVPVIIFIHRQGLNLGLMLLAVATVVVSLLFGSLYGMGAIVNFGVLSVCLSFYMARKDNRALAVLKTTVVSLAVVYILTFIVAQTKSGSFDQLVRQQIDMTVSEAIRLYDQMKLPASQKVEITDSLLVMKEIFKTIYWGFFAAFTLGVVLANDLVGRIALRKINISQTEISFAYFSFPDELVWGFIASAGLWFLKLPPFDWVGINSAIFFIMLYLLQGAAVVTFILEKKKISVFLKVMGGLILAFQPIFLVIIVGTGIFDIWFDFRKIRKA